MRCSGHVVAVFGSIFALGSAHADVNVTISKSQQQMLVSIDGGPTYRWPISTGRAGYTTPSGSFNPIRLERVYYSKKYDDAPMPNSVFFYGGYAIHGTFEERNLGNPVSHGCVRLSRENAAVLYAAVQAHGMSRTHIRITDAPVYGGPPVAGGYDERRHRESYETSSRRYERDVERPPRVVTREPVYRGFEAFAAPGYREPQRQVYWYEAAPRDHYSAAGRYRR